MTKKNATKTAQDKGPAATEQIGDASTPQPETSAQDQDTTTANQSEAGQDESAGNGINMADEAMKAHIQAVDPNSLIGIPVQYHDNGNGTTQRTILPAQMLQKRNGQPDVLVVFASTVPMELKAWFKGDANRNTTEPYWTLPGMGA